MLSIHTWNKCGLMLLMLLSALPGQLLAEPMSYDYLGIDLIPDSDLNIKGLYLNNGYYIEDENASGDGYELSGSFEPNPGLVLSINYRMLDFQPDNHGGTTIDTWETSIGAAWRKPINKGPNALDLVLGVALDDIETEFSDNLLNSEDDGLRFRAGLRRRMTDRLELNGELAVLSYDDSSGSLFRVGGRYSLSPEIDAELSYRTRSLEVDDDGPELDFDSLNLGVRYNF